MLVHRMVKGAPSRTDTGVMAELTPLYTIY
jgi:hypothetical protein